VCASIELELDGFPLCSTLSACCCHSWKLINLLCAIL